MEWTQILAAVAVALLAIVGLGLTVITLPGLWLPIGAALLIQWWRPGDELLFDWSTIIACVGMGVLAEVIEFLAGSLGAAKAGSSKRGALAAGVGSLIGALVGAPVGLFVGAIIGAVAGAGVGAYLAERYWVKKTGAEATRAMTGAAIGRAIAMVVKTALAAAIGVTLSVAAWR